MPSSTASIATPTQRDPRLAFYRGIAMFIILVAHTPGNFLTLWIPARFGFSDATEIFVFCSGMASAIAFGKAFEHRGWFLGTARVAFRVWQVYWAHIAVFFVIAVLMATLNSTELFKKDYIGSLNLWPFFKDPVPQLMGLMTLTYVPNYFDILPMYIAILAMMPIVVGLKNMHGALAVVFVLVIWLGANMGYLAMPAEPWSERTWFFNPFGWQLVFFTGFALMSATTAFEQMVGGLGHSSRAGHGAFCLFPHFAGRARSESHCRGYSFSDHKNRIWAVPLPALFGIGLSWLGCRW